MKRYPCHSHLPAMRRIATARVVRARGVAFGSPGLACGGDQ